MIELREKKTVVLTFNKIRLKALCSVLNVDYVFKNKFKIKV